MKYKIIQIILVIGILSIPIMFIFKETSDLSVRYIAIVFSILSSLISLFVSIIILKFVYKMFITFSKEELNEIQCLFLGYLFLNSLILLALKDIPFFYILSVVNPTLIIFLLIITIVYHNIYKKRLIYPAIIFYIINFIFTLIGVITNNV